MNKYLIVSILGSVFVSGCSSSPSTAANGTKVNTVAANQVVSNVAVANTQVPGVSGNAGPTPGTIDQVPEVPMPEGANANTAKLNRERKIVDAPGVSPEPARVPAGENSEVSSTMDKHGNFVETRFFKSHPQLVKVERTFQDPKNSTLKIFLKNGKIVSASGNTIQDFVGTSSAMYLELAGIKAPASSNSATSTKSK